ncbi:MAG: hypothetical protein PHG82_03415 [Candidatus Gracilibacteria bacterium]|nr:hypothetical protein [Candidatus Gracilibacteria bacterium]
MLFNGEEITEDCDGFIYVNGMHLRYQGYKVRKGYGGYYNEHDAEIKNLSGKSLEEVLNLCMKGGLASLLALFLLLKIKSILNSS